MINNGYLTLLHLDVISFSESGRKANKKPRRVGALNILLQYSNDITNPVKRLYATTNIDFFVSL